MHAPLGVSLFVACSISNTKIGAVVLPMIPYLIAMLIVLLLATFIRLLQPGFQISHFIKGKGR
jgi:TRAP-type C4-dicarboxylate transport system permease large subunit